MRELRELRRRRVYDEYATAANDPSFTAEMEEVTREFEPTTADGLRDGE